MHHRLKGVVGNSDSRRSSVEISSVSSKREADSSDSSHSRSDSETDLSTELEGSEIEENFGFNSGTETTVLVDCQFDERETYREAETPPNPGRH